MSDKGQRGGERDATHDHGTASPSASHHPVTGKDRPRLCIERCYGELRILRFGFLDLPPLQVYWITSSSTISRHLFFFPINRYYRKRSRCLVAYSVGFLFPD